jgi:hypothetical protein
MAKYRDQGRKATVLELCWQQDQVMTLIDCWMARSDDHYRPATRTKSRKMSAQSLYPIGFRISDRLL